MEIYVALSDFVPPVVDGSQNILSFDKGDSFEIFDCHKTDSDWWGARSLRTNAVGYVPSRYMQYKERRIGKLLPTDYKDQKETNLKRLSDMQNSPDHRAPEHVIPDTPVPDYDATSTSPQEQSVNVFAEKFKTVISNIKEIAVYSDFMGYNGDFEDMYNQDEPEPDYNDNDEVDFPPPPPESDMVRDHRRTGSQADEEGLIIPKKLPNPCLDSAPRQALHKELLHNYKRGVNVLEKPELDKVLQNRRQTQRKKEWEEQMKASTKRTSFEIKLEQRANKAKEEEMKSITEDEDNATNAPELHKVFKKITQKSNGAVK